MWICMNMVKDGQNTVLYYSCVVQKRMWVANQKQSQKFIRKNILIKNWRSKWCQKRLILNFNVVDMQSKMDASLFFETNDWIKQDQK
jgi:hypothetical protein